MVGVVVSSWRRWLLVVLALVLGGSGSVLLAGAPAHAADPESPKVLLLLDVSGSMNEKLPGGGTKFAAAQKALKEVAGALPAGTDVGLRVYGSEISESRKVNPKACLDTRLVLPIGPLDASRMNRAVDSFKAQGSTPIAYSLEKSVADLGGTGKRVLVLISDGEETCKGDPCPTAKKLLKSGVDLQFNAIGLKVGTKARQQLQCIADAGDGSYYDASEADELSEVLRKITQRSLRPLQLSGTPVRATAEEATAPTIQNGQYLDRYLASEDKEPRFYRISRTPGSTVTASITSLVTGRGSGGGDFWTLRLRTVSGKSCGAGSAGASNYNRTGVLSGAVTSLSPVAAAAATPAADGCATEPLLLGLSRTTLGGTPEAVPVEIHIAEEPAVTNLAALPGPASYKGGEGERVAASARVTAVVGGSSFSNAAELTAGSWRDSVALGETVLYRVRLETGQRLRVTLDAPAPQSSWRLSGAETAAPEIQLYAANRAVLRRQYAVLQGRETRALTAVTPEVRVRNREHTSSSELQATSMAGDYFVAVALTPVQRDLTGRVMPIQLNVAVDGKPAGQPIYAGAGVQATPSAAASPSTTPSDAAPTLVASPSDTASTAGSTVASPPPETGEGGGGVPVTALVGGGVALVLAGVGAGLLVARRRGRKS